jgi:hypothetical protein
MMDMFLLGMGVGFAFSAVIVAGLEWLGCLTVERECDE